MTHQSSMEDTHALKKKKTGRKFTKVRQQLPPGMGGPPSSFSVFFPYIYQSFYNKHILLL